MNHINNEIDRVILKQATLKTPINFSGVGVHNGRSVNMTIYPAKQDTGIIFKRLDINKNNIIEANNIGCHIITAPPEMIEKSQKLFHRDLEQYSKETVKMFYDDALASGFKL